MTIEEVIRELERRHPDCSRGETAKEGSKYYDAACQLDFHECACARSDPAYSKGFPEFVAEGPAGGCHVVGVNPNKRVISCGPNGYHLKRRPICRS